MKKIVLITLCLIAFFSNVIAQKREVVKLIYNKSYVTDSEDPAYVIEFSEIGTNKKFEFVTSVPPNITSLSALFWNSQGVAGDNTMKDKIGKKFLIVYFLQQNKTEVGLVEEKNMQTCEEIPDDNYPKASCKVYDEYGVLKAICENGKIHLIKKGKKKEEGTAIQNKNEICQGSKCLRTVIDGKGMVKIYKLPNTTDGRTVGKIIGNKLYACNKDDGSDVVPGKSTLIEFKGDKIQAAVVAISEQFFR
ncbi:MAG: hypothetical protein K0S32_2483 [Bacteroidetes bacterium]|jgi:hypothetical protein|nr:hypothetical protein [Bacteroidota bacterium]